MKINYANKVSLNPIPTVKAINKVQDIDMNNIKNAVNENSSYIALQMPSQQAMDTAGQINFDISLTGILETNDFIYVQFPASTTNLTSTISLNVNNSNIYPVIFGNGNAILSQVQNQALKLIFQGNSFVVYNEVYESVFPIGRGFIDFTDTDYSNYLGFTWQKALVGLTPIGAGTHTDGNGKKMTFTLGQEYGEYEHKLVDQELPNISGTFVCNVPENFQNYFSGIFVGKNKGTGVSTPNSTSGMSIYGYDVSFGNDQPHNNIQPSYAVNYWQRVA